MRENEEQFRRFVPLLRRIVILVAVIVAVPVILWTITAFVRAYISPPKLHVFHQLASTGAPLGATANAPASDGSSSGPEQDNLATSSSATPDDRTAAADASDAPNPPNALSSDRPVDANAPHLAAKLADVSATPPPWPDTQPASNGFEAAATSSAVDVATVLQPEAMPAAAPLAGPIPFPPHRPRVLALASANVPMPRPRPGLAPSRSPPEAASPGSTPLEFLRNLFH